MKKGIYTLALLLISIATFSKGIESTYSVTTNGTGIFTIHYQGEQAGKVKVSIYDSKKNIVFMEVLLNVNTFTRPYNFTGLPTGEYTIVIEDSMGKQEERIAYRGTKDKNLIRFFKAPLL